MKKTCALFLALLLLLSLMAGCASAGAEEDGGLDIVCTVFPLYDWARELAGDDARVTWLLRSGVDLHSYQPSADDIIRIANCDIFLYVGGVSDAWVENALKESVNPDMTVICLMDVLGPDAKLEELVEGMEADEHEHDGHEDSGHGDHDNSEYDEHVWLSLRNAQRFCQAIAQALETADETHADGYAARLDSYCGKLRDLDALYTRAVEDAAHHTLVFCDRFPFRYLMDDYGLSYYAAFAGCSSETAASFETVAFLAGKTDELGLGAVLTIEGGDGSLARTVVSNTRDKNKAILTLDSMQSVTTDRAAEGVSYLSLMEDNLAVLRDAMN